MTKAQDLIAIAMPLYGHAALVIEALESALASVSACRLAIVVSVDGDPHHEVFDQLTLHAAAHPEVHVIFGENAGPGGAATVRSTTSSRSCPRPRRSIFSTPTTASCRIRSRRSIAG
ncbi:hypothetical protein BTHI11S_05388 [Bosea thiooxidans]